MWKKTLAKEQKGEHIKKNTYFPRLFPELIITEEVQEETNEPRGKKERERGKQGNRLLTIEDNPTSRGGWWGMGEAGHGIK